MPPATNEEQFRFLISCIRWSNNGRVDFQEVANECSVVSKGAAAKRYERMMRAHGIHPNGGPAVPPGTPSTMPKARQQKAARDGGDRFGKAKKAEKQKAKQAQFDEERDMDMDDEEGESGFNASSSSSNLQRSSGGGGGSSSEVGVKHEPVGDGDDINQMNDVKRLEVKAEQTEDGYDAEQSGTDMSPSPAVQFSSLASSQHDGIGSPGHISYNVPNTYSQSFGAQFGSGSTGSERGSAYALSPPPSSSPAFGMSLSPGVGPMPDSFPSCGFNFNDYTPRQHTPTPFFTGTRTPEEVVPAEPIAAMGGAGSPRPQDMGGAGSPGPQRDNEVEGEVIQLD